MTDERRPHLVTVFGPAGIGKSRLALEFAQHRRGRRRDAHSADARPRTASNSPYSAFGHHVKQTAQVFDSDELDEARAKLEESITRSSGSQDGVEHARHLGILMGLGGEGDVSDRETLFFSARVFVEALAAQEPTVLLFEDIHWADASLLDLLETLATRVRDVPLLLLALARPEVLTQRPGWGGGLPAYTALPLDRLSEDHALSLAELLLGDSDQGATRAGAVALATEGNPLFIEELAASLVERSTTDVAVLPTSVRAIVAARLDALPPEERSALVDASVVGRVFWRGALACIADRDNLSALLGALEERDLVRREAVSRIQGDQQFAFKHALIRDVAYQTLPRAARRDRHAAVARYLEESTAGVGQALEALAHHWREAGDDERAVEYLLEAAEQAGRGWAKEHALALYAEALQLVPETTRSDAARSGYARPSWPRRCSTSPTRSDSAKARRELRSAENRRA